MYAHIAGIILFLLKSIACHSFASDEKLFTVFQKMKVRYCLQNSIMDSYQSPVLPELQQTDKIKLAASTLTQSTYTLLLY